MTFLEAAEKVLKRAQRPMRTEEIVTTAFRNGWLSSDGKTPVATMRGQLGTHVGKGGKMFCVARCVRIGDVRAQLCFCFTGA